MPYQTRIFRLFVSSTFTDMRAERRLLQREVFPRLEALCEGRGARFQAVDLRWGVSESSQLDHRTMDICLGEIRRCQRLSPRPNFLILLGDRYGWQPVPSRIPAGELDALRAAISSPEELRLLGDWYRRDDDAVPAEYVLVPRQDELAAYDRWESVERRLRDILRDAARRLDLPEVRRTCYFASATHQEILAGALAPAGPGDERAGAALAYARTIRDLPGGAEAADYLDLDGGRRDESAAAPLAALKASLREKLGGGYREYGAAWVDGAVVLDDGKAFSERVFQDLRSVIEDQLAETAGEDELRREEAQHGAFQAGLVEHFGGRDRELSQLRAYLDDPGRTGPLALIGPSGSGKSSLMAKAIDEARARPGVMVSRFIGTTSASGNLPTLLFGLCAQLAREFGKDPSALAGKRGEERLREPAVLRELFGRCLALATAEKPVTVWLDALDQLADADGAAAPDWLPRKLPAFAKIVVSALPELETQLGQAEALHLGVLPVPEAERILDGWLAADGRTLTGSQRALLLERFRASGQPIFLRLAYQRARTWRSHDAEPALPSDVDGILSDFFDLLEKEHTRELVGTAMRYLLGARYRGLTESELLELLFFDEAYRESFISRTHPDHRDELRDAAKLPVVVWSRLFLDLEPYLTERDADGVPVMTLFHRVFVDFLTARYRVTRDCYRNAARYFTAQPLFHGEAGHGSPNLRKLTELAHAQILAGMCREAVETSVGNPAFLEAKVRAGLTFQLQRDLALYLEDQRCSVDREHIAGLARFIRTEGHLLSKHGRFPGFLLQQLWNDGAELAPGEDPAAVAGVPLFLRKKAWRSAAAAPSRLTRTWTGHGSEVTAVAISADGRIGATAGRYDGIRVWDLQTGRCLSTLHTEGLFSMAMTPCGRYLAAGSHGLTLHDTRTSTSRELEPNDGGTLVSFLSFTPDGSRLASGRRSRTRNEKPGRDAMAVWSVETGELVQGFAGFREILESLFLSPDGRSLVQGDPLRKWDVASGRCLVQYRRLVPKAVSADGTRVVDCGLKVRDLETGELVQECRGYDEYLYSTVAASADLSMVLATVPGTFEKRDFPVQAWNALEGKLLFSLAHTDQVGALAVTPDGSFALSATGSAAHLWDLRPGAHAAAELPVATLHDTRVDRLLFTRAGDRLLSADAHGVIQLVDGESGEKVRTLVGHTGSIWDAAAADTRELAATVSYDHSLAAWELGADRPAFRAEAGALTAGEKEKRVAEKLAELRRQFGDEETNKRIGISLDLERMAATRALEGVPFFRHVVITPDGSRVLAGCDDGTVWAVAVPGYARLEALAGAKESFAELTLSPDGSRLLSLGGHGDECIRAWDLESGAVLYETQGAKVTAFAVSRDGRFLLSAEGDKQLRFRGLRDGTPFDAVPAQLDEAETVHWSDDGLEFRSRPYWSAVERIVMAADGRRAFLCCCAMPSAERHEYFIQVLDLASKRIVATHRMKANHDNKRLFELSGDGRWGINDHAGNCLELWDLATGATRAIYQHPHAIKSLALDRAGRHLAIGDDSGGVVVFDGPRDRAAPPAVTARRIRLLGGAHQAGRWAERPTVDCPFCGSRFPLGGRGSAAIEPIEGQAADPPSLRLDPDAWRDPGLACTCPRCGAALRLNPFVVDPAREAAG